MNTPTEQTPLTQLRKVVFGGSHKTDQQPSIRFRKTVNGVSLTYQPLPFPGYHLLNGEARVRPQRWATIHAFALNAVLVIASLLLAGCVQSRLRALNNISDQAAIAEVAMGTRESYVVRAAAIVKLTDQALLTKVATTAGGNDSGKVRIAAVDKLTDQAALAEVAVGGGVSGERALDHLTDQSALLTVTMNAMAAYAISSTANYSGPGFAIDVGHSRCIQMREKAVKKLTDREMLRKVSLENSVEYIRRAAAARLRTLEAGSQTPPPRTFYPDEVLPPAGTQSGGMDGVFVYDRSQAGQNNVYRVLRFYPDGLVLDATMQLPGGVLNNWPDINKWFHRDNKGTLNRGEYFLANGSIWLTATYHNIPQRGVVRIKFLGTYSDDALKLDTYSDGNDHGRVGEHFIRVTLDK